MTRLTALSLNNIKNGVSDGLAGLSALTGLSAMVIQQCINNLQEKSEAAQVLKQLRTAAKPALEAAAQGRYVPWQPTAAETDAALRNRKGLPEYEKNLMATFKTRFEGLCNAAAAQNLLVTSSSSSSSSSSQSPTPTASGSTAADAVKVEFKVGGAANTAPALRTTPIVLYDDEANPLSPNMYAVERILTLFEIAFGTATQQQENEFKALKQGSMTVDAFAYELENRSRTLQHKNYSEQHLVQLFVHGLQDRACASSLSQQHGQVADHAPVCQAAGQELHGAQAAGAAGAD
jgi:hypothetical protein